MIDEAPPEAVAPEGGGSEDEGTGGWTPPPEAPPAETWQAVDQTAESGAWESPAPTEQDDPAPPPRPPGGRARPEPAAEGRNVALTPEMIDLIAEKVVQRLADRVVREVAWEIVPEVEIGRASCRERV